MIPSTPALLMCVAVLCGLEETVRSQRAHCAGNQCLAFFLEPETFPGAQKSCQDSGGQLYTLSWETVDEIVTVSGSYWVQLPSNDTAAEDQSCPSISLSTGGKVKLQRVPCGGTLKAFLCQYTFEEPCVGVLTGAGAQVTYTAPMDFRLDNSETFPPGTIAVTMKVGGIYLESKHVCVSRGWMPAPWSCEVLGGGCQHTCTAAANTCACPPGEVLHPNNISCTTGACEENRCTGEGEECENTREGFRCTCGDDFVEEDGACVNVTICQMCEHMLCEKFHGVYQCVCRKGFRVAAHDPTKCELICAEKDCPARCDWNNQASCFCPVGYIKDIREGGPFCTDIDECDMGQCHQKCENLFGGYRCSCDVGFKLRDGDMCIAEEEENEDDNGSGSSPPPPPREHPTPASALPAAVPYYVKTGSVLGIGVFVMLCAVLLYFLVRNAAKRCGRFELTSIKHRDIDIFYLQQVTSETYKRLSLDKPFKRDS
ncbi:thrombomodulin-like [Pseudoliparis swirei]|uniref:thrombomodulin-like n=1 Tax=Pseudoliparis swirei TaxID=2059687 RepID=UPI0024BD9A87|nr:thrombomodulin-like [Pseudoliparis swirei]